MVFVADEDNAFEMDELVIKGRGKTWRLMWRDNYWLRTVPRIRVESMFLNENWSHGTRGLIEFVV